jgi:outer membrane putative beta-barrel porin/alpha-amylase
MAIIRPGRVLLGVASLCLLLPAGASAQLAGLISRVIQESTINRPGPPGTPGGNHQPHFLVGESLAASARQMNVELGAQLLSFPLGSSSGGFSFTTDSMTGEISPSSETFGPAFAERAITLGKGQFNVGLAFQAASFDSFEGVKLDSGDLSFIRVHNDCCVGPAGSPTLPTNFDPAFERDLLQSNLRLDMSSRATVIFGNYGVTDRFDLGFAVPFVHVDIDAAVDGTIRRTASSSNPLIHSFDGAGADHATFLESGSSDGIGDISVRAKYNFLRGDTTSLAGFLDLRLPTGDADELLGTGATRTQMLFVYSGDYGRVSPHVNFGYTFSSGESSEAAAIIDVDPAEHRTADIAGAALAPVDLEFPDELNYIFGVNFAAHPRVTVGFDVHGRTLMDTSRFELRDNTYPNRGPGALPTDPFIALSEFTLLEQKENLNLVLGVIGGKFNVAKTLLLNVNLLFPMSDGGLKPKTTLSLGFDYVF